MDAKKIIIFSLLFLILFVTSCNFIMINCGIEKTFNQSLVTINKIDSIVNNQLLTETEGIKLQKKMLEFQEDKFKEYLTEMNNLKKGVFDSNTITFMVSFVLVFLGGILFGIEDRAKKQIDRTKKQIDKSNDFFNHVEMEQKMIDLYTQIQIIKLSAINLESTLDSKEYKIDNSINILVYELFKTIEDLLKEICNEKYKFITKEKKKNFVDIFSRIFYTLKLDYIKEKSENINKTFPIEKTIDKLEELREKVLGIKELQ